MVKYDVQLEGIYSAIIQLICFANKKDRSLWICQSHFRLTQKKKRDSFFMKCLPSENIIIVSLYVSDYFIKERYISLMSSTVTGRGLPGVQASLKASADS